MASVLVSNGMLRKWFWFSLGLSSETGWSWEESDEVNWRDNIYLPIGEFCQKNWTLGNPLNISKVERERDENWTQKLNLKVELKSCQ